MIIGAHSQHQVTYIYISQCAEGTFAVRRLEVGASIDVDLKKTDSVMNPYLGIVHIEGRFVSNASSPAANGFADVSAPSNRLCFKTPQEAMRNVQHQDFTNDPAYVLSFKAYYHVDNGVLSLSGGDERFKNAFLSGIQLEFLNSKSPWSRAIRFPIEKR